MVMFIGNVIARAMGKNKPGFACGAAIFMAAGTAMYEALAPSMAKMNLFATSCVTILLASATMQPFMMGMAIPKMIGNEP